MVVPNFRLIGFVLGFFLIVSSLGSVCFAEEVTPTPTEEVSQLNQIYNEYCNNLDFALDVFSYTVSTVIDHTVITLSDIQDSFLSVLNRRSNSYFGNKFKENNFLNDWFATNITYNVSDQTYHCSNEFIEVEQEVVKELSSEHGYVIGYTEECRYKIASFPSNNKYLSWKNIIGGDIGVFPSNVNSTTNNSHFWMPLDSDVVFIRHTLNDSGVFALKIYSASLGTAITSYDDYVWNNEDQVFEESVNPTTYNNVFYLKQFPSSFVGSSFQQYMLYSGGYRQFYIFSTYADYLLFTDGRVPIMQGDHINDSFNNTQIDNSVTYGDVINHFGNETSITADQVGDYINNYNDNVTNNNGGGGGDNNGGGASGILDALSGFMDFIGRLIGILVNGITNLLESLVDALESIVSFIPNIFSTYLSSLFDWLPQSVINLIVLSVTLSVVIFIIKIFRG